MSLDTAQLTARFREGFDLSSNQVLTLNKPTTDVDDTKPWCRFSVSLGERAREENGASPTYLQLGGVFLQVFIPKALGVAAGDEMVKLFDDLFCDWRSGDGALQVGRQTRTFSEQPTYYQVNVRFAFQSLRART